MESDLTRNIADAEARAAAQMKRPCPVVPQTPAPVAPPSPVAPPGSAGKAKKKDVDPDHRIHKLCVPLTAQERYIIIADADMLGMSQAEYARQSMMTRAMSRYRAEDQRAASLDMIGLLRADLTRCVATLQRRPDKDREMIDIMITLQHMLDTINRREEDLSC